MPIPSQSPVLDKERMRPGLVLCAHSGALTLTVSCQEGHLAVVNSDHQTVISSALLSAQVHDLVIVHSLLPGFDCGTVRSHARPSARLDSGQLLPQSEDVFFSRHQRLVTVAFRRCI